MSDQPSNGPNWYPDPAGRHQYRWHDGNQWTDQVSDNGRQSTSPLTAPAQVVGRQTTDKRLQQNLDRAGVQVGAAQGGGTLFTEPVLVVNQKAKLIELNNEYSISDQHGNQIGAVRQVGQSKAKKVLRAVSNADMFMTHHLQITDAQGQVMLQLTKPRALIKSSVVVQDATGQEIGTIRIQIRLGKVRLDLMVGDQKVGEIRAQNLRGWNFSILDGQEQEIANITKTWQGFAKAAFTTADNYVVQIHRPIEGPLQAMTVAAAVSIDTIIGQAGG